MYFVSNTTLFFDEGEYHLDGTDLIVQNVINFSLIGIPDINNQYATSSVSVISCLQECQIYFLNVINVLIKGIILRECGSLIPESIEMIHAAMFIRYCNNVDIINVNICNPVGYGIIASYVTGINNLENVAITLNRDINVKLLSHLYSFGVLWSYGSAGIGIVKNDKQVIHINNISLTRTVKHDNGVNMKMLEFVTNRYSVVITIKNSVFSNMHNIISIKIAIDSLSHSSIHFYRCRFTTSYMKHHVYILYTSTSHAQSHPKLDVTIAKTVFSSNIPDAVYTIHDYSILRFDVLSQYEINITINDVKFYRNRLPLLVLSASQANQSNVLISTTGYIVEENELLTKGSLISLQSAKLYFNEITKFIENKLTDGDIVHLSSSMLTFSNDTLFDRNVCNRLFFLNCEMCYVTLLGNANLTLSNNLILRGLTDLPIRTNLPYPYCIFQYFCPVNNKYEDFKITLLFDNINVNKRVQKSIHHLTSHCKWAPGAAFRDVSPSVVNQQIISIRYRNKTSPYQLGDHTTICYCPQSSCHNCSADHLGPVYPGQMLTVELCLPYNEEQRAIMYTETYNINLPKSSCKTNDNSHVSHIFNSSWSRTVHFPIVSEQPAICELFVTAPPNLFYYYDVFYVQLLPCPLGFTLQGGVCDCDPYLRKYIDGCSLNYQTVTILPNVYILGFVNETNKYMISTDCPITYCSQDITRINLSNPDGQCQPHKTGALCSQCVEGYSVVFGSYKCRKCTNLHLLYIIYFLFTGIFLIVVLFLLNLTVTLGTINGIILYANVVRINSPFLHLQERLVAFLRVYISIINLGSPFEICVYKGMNKYTKKWIQLTYPLYLLLIATLFIYVSRYSNKLYRLTFNKALPVLATLFMLSYTSMLQAIARVFLYTTVTYVPHQYSKYVWLLDPTIPIFGWKFLLLTGICALLFLLLLAFSAIMLFTKPLMRFNIIHRFKPIIDAFHGPFKYQYYYWIGIQLLIRNVMVLLAIFGKSLSITTSCLIIVTIAIIHGYMQPNKSKLINVQESLLLYNYIILCVLLLFNKSELLNMIIVNVMVGLSFLQSLLIIVYHLFAYLITTSCSKLMDKMTIVKNCIMKKCHHRRRHRVCHNEYSGLEIPEVEFDFTSFREPLIAEDN